jgi:hypothetical protein
LGIGGLHVGDIDDGVNSDEGVVETIAGEHIDTACASDHDDVMSCPPQGLNGVATDDAGATDHCNAHRLPPSDNSMWSWTGSTTPTARQP